MKLRKGTYEIIYQKQKIKWFLFLVEWSTDVQKWDFILMFENTSLFSLLCFVIIGWSWDRPIVMRFIQMCFDHCSFFFHLIFLAAQSLCKIPCGLESSKRFCSMKALTSIQELANCTVKGWLMVLVLWIQKKGSFAQLRLKGSELHVQTQFYFWDLLLF